MVWFLCCTQAFWKLGSLGLFSNNKQAWGPSSLLCGQQTFLSGGTLASPFSAETHQKSVSAWNQRSSCSLYPFFSSFSVFCFFLSSQVQFSWTLNVKIFLFIILHASWAHADGGIGACTAVSGQLLMFSTKHQLFSTITQYLMLHSAGRQSVIDASAVWLHIYLPHFLKQNSLMCFSDVLMIK